MATDDTRSTWLLVVGTAVVAIGALLPWATVNAGLVSVSKAGTDGDGVITLLLALVVGGLVLAKWKAGLSRAVVIVSLVLGAIVLAVATYDAIDVASTVEESEFVEVRASVGIGLWLTLVGRIAMIAGAIWELRSPTPGAATRDARAWAAPPAYPSTHRTCDRRPRHRPRTCDRRRRPLRAQRRARRHLRHRIPDVTTRKSTANWEPCHKAPARRHAARRANVA
ncbi:MAG TPA: hypothetical protein VFZ77_02005 [Acidimicrobiales bacterium]